MIQHNFPKRPIKSIRLTREMYEVTGYHLKDLEVIDGRYVTPEGRDLIDVYKEELEKIQCRSKRLLMLYLTIVQSSVKSRKLGIMPFRISSYQLITAMDL